MLDRPVPDQNIGRSLVALAVGIVLFVSTIVGWSTLRSSVGSTGVSAILWVNVILILGAIVFEAGRRPYSLHLMHLIAAFLFLGAAALFQYSSGQFGVAGSVALMRRHILPAALVVTLWMVGYILGYELLQGFVKKIRPGPVLRVLQRPITRGRATATGIAAFGILLYLGAIGLAGAETRAGAREALSDYSNLSGQGAYSGAFFLIHQLLLRAFPMVATLAVLLMATRVRGRGRGSILLAGTLVVGVLIFNNPFASSRMWFQTAVFGFTAPFLFSRMRTGSALILAVTVGVSLVPSLHFSRYSANFAELLTHLEITSPFAYLATSVDVDSLGMLTLCVKWLETHGHRWGMQILGALFSWIPRAIWPSKPIGTGAMVTEDLGFSFTNLSPPLPSEVLVDFGFAGIPIAAALFGALLWRLDQAYWGSGGYDRSAHPRVIDCIYPFWLGCVVYLTRGDLFAAFTQTASYTFWILPLVIGLGGVSVASIQAKERVEAPYDPSAPREPMPPG